MPLGLVLKIGLIGLTLAGLAGGVWDYIRTKQSNAVLEASLVSTTAAFGKYATTVEAEVDGWSQAAQILSEKYQFARDERDAKIKRLSQADFTKMATRHPEMLARRINAASKRVWEDLERITRRSRAIDASEPTAARTTDTPSGNMDGT